MSSFAISNPDIASYVTPGSPDYDELIGKSQVADYYKKTGASKAGARLINAGANAFGSAKKGDLQADSIISSAKAQADATRSNGMWDMIGSIGGGLLGGIKKKGKEEGNTGEGKGGDSWADNFSNVLDIDWTPGYSIDFTSANPWVK